MGSLAGQSSVGLDGAQSHISGSYQKLSADWPWGLQGWLISGLHPLTSYWRLVHMAGHFSHILSVKEVSWPIPGSRPGEFDC